MHNFSLIMHSWNVKYLSGFPIGNQKCSEKHIADYTNRIRKLIIEQPTALQNVHGTLPLLGIEVETLSVNRFRIADLATK